MQHFLIIVEGAHDIAFLGKVLKTLNFQEVKRVRELSSLMEIFIPKNFPFVEDKLNIFNFIPFFIKKRINKLLL